jgi:glycosyltransferase involved in cell wall biosynthesis
MPKVEKSRSIAHVVESFGAGTLHVVASIANYQAKEGWDIVIFHGSREETPSDFRELFAPSITLIPLKTGRAINGMIDAIDVLRVAYYARKHRIEIIHGHSSKGGAIARSAALLNKSRAFYSPHGFSFMVEGGVDKSRKTFLIEKFLAKLPGEIVCCSASEHEAAKLLGGTSSCIENFVDAEEIRQAIASAPVDKEIDVVTVGRISDQKNPALFAELANRLPHLRFCWIGGPIDAVKVDWPANVQITGWRARDEVMKFYAKSRVFLTTSRYEGMPIVMLEAMAAGLPIVSTNVPGSKDVVRDGETGFLCETINNLETRLTQIISDDALADRLASAATRAVLKHYDTRVVLQKWKSKYQLAIPTSAVE